MKIVVASGNQGKLKEIQSVLEGLPVTLLAQSEFNIPSIEENGLSFLENALLKARHAAKCTHLPALADDSGLCVDTLKGAPGIYSARFAGPNANSQDNIAKLLAVLEKNPARQAYFHCTLVFVRHAFDPMPLVCQANWDGEILTAPQGQQGFGYDPIFFLPELQCSAAELTAAQKNTLSHRGQALQEFARQFKQYYASLATS